MPTHINKNEHCDPKGLKTYPILPWKMYSVKLDIRSIRFHLNRYKQHASCAACTVQYFAATISITHNERRLHCLISQHTAGCATFGYARVMMPERDTVSRDSSSPIAVKAGYYIRMYRWPPRKNKEQIRKTEGLGVGLMVNSMKKSAYAQICDGFPRKYNCSTLEPRRAVNFLRKCLL